MQTHEDTVKLMQAIQHRRSIRLVDIAPEPIDLTLVQLILDAAPWVPNHGRTEPWRFSVYSGEARRALGEAFAEAYRLGTPPEEFKPEAQAAQRERVWNAPVWISVGMTPPTPLRFPVWEEIMSVGMAVQNMHLIAASLGLAMRWSSGNTSLHAHTAEFVGLAPPSELYGFLYLGNPKPGLEWPAGKRSPMSEKVTWHNA